MKRKNHRSRFEITAEILEYCKNVPKRQNWACLHININNRVFKPIMHNLIANGLCEAVNLKKHRITRNWRCIGYLTTDVGKNWLMKYYALVGAFNVVEAKVK